MKFVLIFSPILLLSLISCGSGSSSKDEAFGRVILSSVVGGDFEELRSHYVDQADTSNMADSMNIHKMKFWFEDEMASIQYAKTADDKTAKIVLKASKTSIQDSEVEFLRIEVDTVQPYTVPYYGMKIYFLKDKIENFIEIHNLVRTPSDYFFYSIEPFMTQEEYAELERIKRIEEASRIYQPYGLEFLSCNWLTKGYEPKSFSKFYVTLKNDTENEFNKVEFRVTIYDSMDFPKREIFSKTITKNKTIKAGDIVRFEVDDLRDYYIGVDVSDENSFDWYAEIVDAKPIPGYEDVEF